MHHLGCFLSIMNYISELTFIVKNLNWAINLIIYTSWCQLVSMICVISRYFKIISHLEGVGMGGLGWWSQGVIHFYVWVCLCVSLYILWYLYKRWLKINSIRFQDTQISIVHWFIIGSFNNFNNCHKQGNWTDDIWPTSFA